MVTVLGRADSSQGDQVWLRRCHSDHRCPSLHRTGVPLVFLIVHPLLEMQSLLRRSKLPSGLIERTETSGHFLGHSWCNPEYRG